MSIAYFNISSRKTLPKLFLCKPNKQVISPLIDIYKLNLHTRLGAISEMSFSVPTKIERNHRLVDNPLIAKIKDRFYVKMDYENQTEYFVFLKQNKQLAGDGKSITYNLYSTSYLLNDKYIYKLEETGWTISQFATKILEETNWRVGSVDAHYELMERYMDISSKTVLQSLFDLAEYYNAIILFNTRDETINFFNPNNIGLNKGLKINDKRFLESLNVETKADEMITRLHVYGKDGLNIRKLTPTGSDFIQDFSFFMHPFECDDNYNVLKSSEYMSDELCVAIVKYNDLLSANGGVFNVLLTNATAIEATIVLQKEHLNTLETELNVLLDERDVINATYGESAVQRADHIAVTNNIHNKNAEIVSQNNTISQLYSNLSSVQHQIESLNGTLKMETNFTGNLLLELNKFIIAKEHTNDSIVEEEDLLNEAFEVFETLNEPPINITLSIEGYLESLQNGTQLQKIALGDMIRVEDAELGMSYRLKILEIEFDFDDLSINLTIANGKEIIDDNAKLVDMIYSANNTSTTVSMDKFKWNLAVTANDNVSRILNSEWDAVKNAVLGGYNQNITISERGLVAKDITDPMNWLVLQNGVLAITNDNGNSWKTAITKNGIFAERIIGKLLIGNKLHIEDEEGIITITGGSQKVHDLNGNVRVELGKYSDPSNVARYGLRINSGSIEIIDGLPKSQIESSAVANWDNAESNARAYADSLKLQTDNEIADIFNELDDFKDVITSSFMDEIIEQAEAVAIEKYINSLNTEKADLDRRYNLIINDTSLSSTPKTSLTNAKTAFNNAHTQLITSINNAIDDRTINETEKRDVDTKFTEYSTSLVALSESLTVAISNIETNKISTAEQNAKNYANSLMVTINQELEDVNSRIDSFDDYIDEAFMDGIVESSEARAIESYINMLNNEKADVNAQYEYIYNISVIPTSYKSNLASTKGAYDAAFTNLISSITTAIEDGKATDAEKTTVNTRFATFRTASASLQTMFQTCIDAITTAQISNADSTIRGDLRLTATLPTSLTLNSSGITATTSNSNNYARLDYRGLYVQGGALDIRTGAATNTGVIINGTGIKGYNALGAQTLNIDSTSGRVTISGAFTIQSNANSASAIRLDESGLYAYDSTGSTKFSISSSGSAYFSGSVSASTISGGSISAASITGGTISGTSISGGTLTGTTIQTSTTSNYGLKIDSNGLSLYNSSGTRTVYMSSTGSASFSGSISGSTITGSTINGGNITVSTDMTIGNQLLLGSQSSASGKGIKFASSALITGFGLAGLEISANNTVIGGGTVSFSSASSVDFSGTTVTGLTAAAIFG